MAISRITTQDTNATGTTTAVATYPAPTQPGNLLIAIAGSVSATVAAVSTSGWLTAIASTGATANSGIFYKLATGTETTVTATGATETDISIFEYTSNARINPITLDGTAAFTAPTGLVTSKATPSITTSFSDLILSAAFVLNAPNNTSGFSWATSTIIGQTGAGQAHTIGGELITPNAQTSYNDTISWTGSANAVTMVAAFRSLYSLGDSGANYEYPKHIIVGDGMSRSEVAN